MTACSHCLIRLFLLLFLPIPLFEALAYGTEDFASESSFSRAGRHPIVRNRPGPDFFEGALLGNGGLGAVVTTRPDAVVIHFGHNNVWDIRLAEANQEKLGTFKEIFERVKAIPRDVKRLEDDPWFRDYVRMARENYDKPYPRPFPCGSLVLGFDRRNVELLGYHLDISTGLCRVQLLADGRPAELQLFVDMNRDRLCARLVDEEQQPRDSCFDRVRLIPDPDTPADLQAFEVAEADAEGMLAFRQVLPFREPVSGTPGPGSPKDRAFSLTLRVNAPLAKREQLNWEGLLEAKGPLERSLSIETPLVVFVELAEGLASEVTLPTPAATETSAAEFMLARDAARENWRSWWDRSGVELEDEFLERIWYWNHYFFHCAAREGVTCPGLFANWSYRKIGTAWHGDYHMNYNTQQPFWLPFSSNRVEKNLPYVELIERLLPLSRKWAREYYGLRGAYFPHSAYPVEMSISPYPVPTWGWEICETPWSVQGLWWHYLYTMDTTFLRDRAFVPLREAVLFLVDYMKRPEAHGPQWGDDHYHVFPTVPPELYGLKPGFQLNYDCLVDLTLIKFVMRAYQEAARVLNLETEEAQTLQKVQDILTHFPEYPTAQTALGTVFVSVPGEHAEVVYNVPNSLMTIFPGEDHGLHSTGETRQILENTFKHHRNEGGNDLVFLNLQAARLGLLDLEQFKRQVKCCLLDNGTCTDMVMQTGGRYSDTTAFNFMRPMGIWFENFALPVVINECLMQSYNGIIRLFPNWPLDKSAQFTTLRAVGAFLVSTSCADGKIGAVTIQSEAGGILRMYNPWPNGARVRSDAGGKVFSGQVIALQTEPGQTLTLGAAE